MNKYIRLSAIAVLTAAALTSCGSHKQTIADNNTYEAEVSRTVTGGSYVERFDAILRADDRWTRVKLPVNFTLESPARFSVTGTAQIERGESVFMSFRMLGFEVAQLYVSDERLLLIDKYHRKYVEESTSALLKGVNVTIDDVQSLLMGQPFVAGADAGNASRSAVTLEASEEVDVNEEGEEVATGNWEVSIPTDVGVICGFMFTPQSTLKYVSAGLKNMIPFFYCEYSQAVSRGESMFASTANFTVRPGNDPKKNFAGSVNWNFDKASWDDDVDPRKLPSLSGYEKVTVDELLKLFAK